MKKVILFFHVLGLTGLTGLQSCNKVSQELDTLQASISAAVYPSAALTGDSVTVVGRLHLDRDPEMTLGGVALRWRLVEARENVPNVGEPFLQETIRFAVTPDMGLGQQELVIRIGAQSQTIPVTIRERPVGGVQDTALVVEEVYNGRFGDLPQATVSGSAVTADGALYLLSAAGLCRFGTDGMQTLLKQGDVLNINGRRDTLDGLDDVTAALDGRTVWLSLRTKITPQQGYRNAYLLVKTAADFSSYTVINQTFYTGGTRVLPLPAVPLSRGNIANSALQATRLKADIQGHLLVYNALGDGGFLRIDPDGAMQPLGLPTGTAVTAFSPDGMNAVCVLNTYPNGDMVHFQLDGGDAQEIGRVPADQEWIVTGYESDKAGDKLPSPGNSSIWQANSALLLSDEELLLWYRGTIGSLNPQNATAYGYAGTDIRTMGRRNTTGPARYVNFSQDPFGSQGGRLIGEDGAGNIWLLGTADPSKAVIFRLGKPLE